MDDLQSGVGRTAYLDWFFFTVCSELYDDEYLLEPRLNVYYAIDASVV